MQTQTDATAWAVAEAEGEQAAGIDVSRYNGVCNWQIAADNGVTFAGIRMTISWGYRDPFGAANMAGAKAANLYRFPYAVLYPGEDPKRQAENFAAAVGGDWQDAWPVIDAELSHDYGKAAITAAIINFGAEIQRVTGKRPVLYSRAEWINKYTELGAWRNTFEWWLAHYLTIPVERASPPALPIGVTSWLIHQTADKIPAFPGFQSGGILTLDRNRWNGTAGDVAQWFGDTGAVPLAVWAGELDAWARTQGYTGHKPA